MNFNISAKNENITIHDLFVEDKYLLSVLLSDFDLKFQTWQ